MKQIAQLNDLAKQCVMLTHELELCSARQFESSTGLSRTAFSRIVKNQNSPQLRVPTAITVILFFTQSLSPEHLLLRILDIDLKGILDVAEAFGMESMGSLVAYEAKDTHVILTIREALQKLIAYAQQVEMSKKDSVLVHLIDAVEYAMQAMLYQGQVNIHTFMSLLKDCKDSRPEVALVLDNLQESYEDMGTDSSFFRHAVSTPIDVRTYYTKGSNKHISEQVVTLETTIGELLKHQEIVEDNKGAMGITTLDSVGTDVTVSNLQLDMKAVEDSCECVVTYEPDALDLRRLMTAEELLANDLYKQRCQDYAAVIWANFK